VIMRGPVAYVFEGTLCPALTALLEADR
jgi:hypothetical protein